MLLNIVHNQGNVEHPHWKCKKWLEIGLKRKFRTKPFFAVREKDLLKVKTISAISVKTSCGNKKIWMTFN
jgi:hypothetical protein